MGNRPLLEHARLLALHCLPRLIAGTEMSQWSRKHPRTRESRGRAVGSGLGQDGSTRLTRMVNEWLAIRMLVGFAIGDHPPVRDPAHAPVDPARRRLAAAFVVGNC